jgi:hypothetical protein
VEVVDDLVDVLAGEVLDLLLASSSMSFSSGMVSSGRQSLADHPGRDQGQDEEARDHPVEGEGAVVRGGRRSAAASRRRGGP